MKYHGSNLEFTHQRNKELMAAFRSEIRHEKVIRLIEVSHRIAEHPASRFWVSEERATVVVSALEKGIDVLATMRRMKREMFEEIYRRYLVERRLNPLESRPSIVTRVVNSPAPKHYMHPITVMQTIFKIQNGYYDRRYDRNHTPGK